MVTLRRKEIYRYLGFRNTQPPEDIVQRVEICVEEMERAAVFRTTHKRFPVTITAPNTVETAGLTIYSKHLYKNLSGCDYVYLFAATVGIGIDRLIKRGEVGGMIDALIYQAAGAEMIEAYVDELNTKLKIQAAAEARLFTHSATSQDLRHNLDEHSSHGAVQIGYSLYRLYERNTRKGRIRILSRRS